MSLVFDPKPKNSAFPFSVFFNPHLVDDDCLQKEQDPFAEGDIFFSPSPAVKDSYHFVFTLDNPENRKAFFDSHCDFLVRTQKMQKPVDIYRKVAEFSEREGYDKESSVFFQKAAKAALSTRNIPEASRCYCKYIEISKLTADKCMQFIEGVFTVSQNESLYQCLLEKFAKVYPDNIVLIFDIFKIAFKEKHTVKIKVCCLFVNPEHLQDYFDVQYQIADSFSSSKEHRSARQSALGLINSLSLLPKQKLTTFEDVHYRAWRTFLFSEQQLTKKFSEIREKYDQAEKALTTDKWKIHCQRAKFELRIVRCDQEAVRAYQKALGCAPNITKITIYLDLGKLFRDTNSKKRAADCFEQGVKEAEALDCKRWQLTLLHRLKEMQRDLHLKDAVMATSEKINALHGEEPYQEPAD